MAEIVLDSFVVAVLQVVFPAALTAVATWFFALTASMIQDMKRRNPDITDKIELASRYAVMVAEQMKSNGTLPDNNAAKKYAIEAASRYLRQLGVRNPEKYVELISDGIEQVVFTFKQ